MTQRSKLLTDRLMMFAALDATIFAPAADLPVLTVRYESRFTAYRQALAIFPAPEMCRCELCLNDFEVSTCAPLDMDYTYSQAVREYSFERDDPLCESCRRDCEAEFGEYASDPADDWRQWGDR